jgi:hypothetical protein
MSEENKSQEVKPEPKAYVEQPVVEKPTSTEVAPDSQNNDLELPDYGQLVQESKKYRKRAQDSEAKLQKMLKEKDIERQKQMESQNEWQALAEERAVKIQELEPIVEQFKRDEAEQRELILSDFNEEDKAQFGGLSLPQLRTLHSRLVKPTGDLVPTDKTPARSLNPTNKDWTTMSESERRSNWGSIVRGYALKK